MNKKIWWIIGSILLVVAGSVVLVQIAFIVMISPLSTLFALSTTKTLSGSVIDCQTQQPIENAEVTVYGTGWGWDNGLIWDKSYSSQARTAADGKFSLSYSLGNVVITRLDGYHMAESYTGSDQTTIQLLKITDLAKSSERTFNCKLSSECYKTRIENDVEISWNDCTNPQ